MSELLGGDRPAVLQPHATLYHADCFAVLRTLPDASVDLVLTDPPYGTTNLEFDKIKLDWPAWWAEIHRVAKPHAIIAVFCAQPFTTDLINGNRRHFRYDLVWQKTNAVGFLDANRRPLRAHETICVFCRRFGVLRRAQGEYLAGRMQSIYNPQFTEGTPYKLHGGASKAKHYSGHGRDLGTRQNDGRRYPTSVLTYPRDPKSWHPTGKPLPLSRYLVRTFSHAGDVVLDTFSGGGSTVEAGLREGRSVIACEMDAVHVGSTVTRLQEAGLGDRLTLRTL